MLGSLLTIVGLVVLVLFALGFAAKTTLRARAARQANNAARIGVEAPTGRDGRSHDGEHRG